LEVIGKSSIQGRGTLSDALINADVLIGVSKGNIVTKQMVESMNQGQIIFAMANPTPEIAPEIARAAGAVVIATGRSDFPNQINNVLVFPGIFRGALDARAKQITEKMKLGAAKALAELVKVPTAEKIIPGPFEKGVANAIADAVKKCVR